MITALHSFDDDAESVLQSMGLDGSVLQEICRRGLAQYLTATQFHATNAPGTFLYHELVHAMRELLVPVGWEAAEEGLAFTFHPELSIALVVSSGNAHAGDATRNPSFKYQKGPTTHAAAAGNAHQLGLFDGFPGMAEFTRSPAQAKKRVEFGSFHVWWLLHNVDPMKGVMNAELSQPVLTSTTDEINQWISRIILEPVPFDDDPEIGQGPDVSDGPDFTVDVRKKA